MINRELCLTAVLDDFSVKVAEVSVRFVEVFVILNEAIDNIIGFFVKLAEKVGIVDDEMDNPADKPVKLAGLTGRLAEFADMLADVLGIIDEKMGKFKNCFMPTVKTIEPV